MEELLSKCKCGVYLSVNENRDVYESVEKKIQEINEWPFNDQDAPEIEPELAKKMIDSNEFYRLQFYPDTPVGFYVVYGTSLKEVVDKALEILKP